MSKAVAHNSINNTELKDLLPQQESEDHLAVDLNDLYAPNGKWTPEQKLFAVVAFMVEGNSVRASKRCGVPPDTIRWWKNSSVWWDGTMRECRRKYQDALDSKLTAIIHKGGDELLDRLEHGDEVVTKDGDVVTKALTARDIATVIGITYDKRALLRGDPTSNPGRGSSSQLDDLSQKMNEISKRLQESGQLAKPIEGEVVTGESVLNYEEIEDERKSK